MIRFRLDDKTTRELKFISRLTYNDIADGKQGMIDNANTLKPVKNVDAYITHFNKPVIEQIVLNTANENMEKAMVEADKGNYEAGRRVMYVNRRMIDSFADSTARGEELENMYRLSTGYDYSLQTARNLSKDSIGRLQKTNRSDNYKIRNKKF